MNYNGIEIKRHIGRITNTGTRVIVVYRELPDEKDSCLVIEADRLPDMYADNMNRLVNSREAQDNVNLYEILNRNSFGDGAPCLHTLHTNGYLKKVPVAIVEMLPAPGQTAALSLINSLISGTPEVVAAPVVVEPEVTDPHEKARIIIEKANALMIEANMMKEEAYCLVPELRPSKGRPSLSEEEKEQTKEQRNARRRARYNAEKDGVVSDMPAHKANRAKSNTKPKTKVLSKTKPKSE